MVGPLLRRRSLCPQNNAKGRVPLVRVAEDGPSVSFVCAISSRRSFDEKILHKITSKEYHESESSARVIARDDTALEMQAKNVRPLNGLCLGRAAAGGAA